MKKFPKVEWEEYSPVIRTDFTDDSAWGLICETIEKPVGDFRAYVKFISDPDYESLTPTDLVPLTEGSGYTFMFLVDQTALSHPDNPIQVVDLSDEPGRTFRVIPSQMWGVQNNLSIANMDFSHFTDALDADGVFRGFPQS